VGILLLVARARSGGTPAGGIWTHRVSCRLANFCL